MVADQLKLPFLYVRTKPKDHGMGNQIEGVLTPGQKVVVIEDLVSTGQSSLAICDTLRQAGADVMALACIFTYGFDVAAGAFEKAGIPLYALSDYNTLSRLAIDTGVIKADQMNTLLKWREEPATWPGS